MLSSRASSRPRWRALLALVLTLGLIAAACGSSGDDEATGDEPSAPSADTGTETDGTGDGAAPDGASVAADPEAVAALLEPESDAADALYPDVIAATLTDRGDGSWDVSATLSSPYDTADRYADAWRIIGSDGTVYGVRELLHDHANEQPFTRSLSAVAIPAGETEIVIQGRDQVSGWGGETVAIPLD